MLTLGDAAGAVYLACGVTDLRRGFNGLAQLVAHELGGEPHSGAMYVFCNRARDAGKRSIPAW
jgi:transposase